MLKKIFKILIVIGVVFLISTIYFYHSCQFWTHLRTDNFKALIEYNGDNIKGLRGQQILINKDFKKYIEQIDGYAKDNNIILIVNQSYRFEKQILSRAVVKPGKFSNHLAGFAIDFNIESNGIKYFSNDLKGNKFDELSNNIKEFINDVRNNRDLRWGGDFLREDPVHIDNPLNHIDRNKWKNFSQNCATDYSNRIPIWKIWK